MNQITLGSHLIASSADHTNTFHGTHWLIYFAAAIILLTGFGLERLFLHISSKDIPRDNNSIREYAEIKNADIFLFGAIIAVVVHMGISVVDIILKLRNQEITDPRLVIYPLCIGGPLVLLAVYCVYCSLRRSREKTYIEFSHGIENTDEGRIFLIKKHKRWAWAVSTTTWFLLSGLVQLIEVFK